MTTSVALVIHPNLTSFAYLCAKAKGQVQVQAIHPAVYAAVLAPVLSISAVASAVIAAFIAC